MMSFIWYARNQKVHDGIFRPVHQVTSQAANQLTRYKAVKGPPCMQQTFGGTILALWSPLLTGYFKMNSDAALP